MFSVEFDEATSSCNWDMKSRFGSRAAGCIIAHASSRTGQCFHGGRGLKHAERYLGPCFFAR